MENFFGLIDISTSNKTITSRKNPRCYVENHVIGIKKKYKINNLEQKGGIKKERKKEN